MIRFGVCVHSLYCSPHHQKSHGGQPKKTPPATGTEGTASSQHTGGIPVSGMPPNLFPGKRGQLPALLAELGEQAVTVGQTGITAQTVASVAGAEEEDIFGDEDGI